jgi:hypothetical protein
LGWLARAGISTHGGELHLTVGEVLGVGGRRVDAQGLQAGFTSAGYENRNQSQEETGRKDTERVHNSLQN